MYAIIIRDHYKVMVSFSVLQQKRHLAYRASEDESFRVHTVGFLVSTGLLVKTVYVRPVNLDPTLTGQNGPSISTNKGVLHNPSGRSAIDKSEKFTHDALLQ